MMSNLSLRRASGCLNTFPPRKIEEDHSYGSKHEQAEYGDADQEKLITFGE